MPNHHALQDVVGQRSRSRHPLKPFIFMWSYDGYGGGSSWLPIQGSTRRPCLTRHGVRGLVLDVRVEARTAVTPASEEVKEARTAVCSRPQGPVHPFSKTTEGVRSHRRVKPMKDAGCFLTRHSERHLLNGLLTSMRWRWHSRMRLVGYMELDPANMWSLIW